MSASILWEPARPRAGESLYTLAPQWFLDCLEKVEISLPYVFGEDDIRLLKGIVAGCGEKNARPFIELIDAIKSHGRVRVWTQY
jgi:hypothetical protein